MSNLQPTTIVDVNGVTTTRNKRVEFEYDSQGRVSSISTTVTLSSPDANIPLSLTWKEASKVVNDISEAVQIGDMVKVSNVIEENFDYGDDYEGVFNTLVDMTESNGSEFEPNDVHHRMYLSTDNNNEPKIVSITVQDFDYYDYNADNFIGQHRFHNDEDAEKAIAYIEAMLVS